MLTSLALMSLYKAPSVPLREISERYLGIAYEEACKRAAKQALPFPTFRLVDSQKAPLMVSCEDLGNWIDQRRDAANEAWQRVQVS
jgi:hypothetical protein